MIENGGHFRRAVVGGPILATSLLVAMLLPAIPAGAIAASISGTVTAAASGSPLANVCVNATEVGGAAAGGGVTDGSGNYAIGAGFPSGTYTVEFYSGPGCQGSPGNYAFQFYDGSTTATASQPVSVTSGSTTPAINAALVVGGSITGTVTTAGTGAGLAGICVNATAPGVPGYQSTDSSANGTYDIPSLATGSYTVEFFSANVGCTTSNNLYAPQWYQQRDSQGNADPVLVTAGQVTSTINSAMTGTASSVTAISVTPSSTTLGQAVVFSATVSGTGGTPTGVVTFSNGYVTFCTANLNPATGAGSCTATNAPVGSYSVTGTYSGNEVFGPSSGAASLSVIAPPPPPHGYWLVGGDGGIFTFGSAQFYGSTGSLNLQRPVVGITPTTDHGGYWLVASDGGIFAFGDAGFYGSIPGLGYAPAGTPGNVKRLNAPVVGMVPSTDGGGYFMVASDGGVFAFGNAQFEGSCPGIGGCSGAAVAVMPDGSGHGYWLVTATGHVYTFGDATYYGAPGPQGSVSSAVRTPDGKGYWILFTNGLVAPFGDAANFGSLPGGTAGGLNPATAIFSTVDGGGYWVATAQGAVYPFGDAPNDGGMAGSHLNAPIIAAVGW